MFKREIVPGLIEVTDVKKPNKNVFDVLRLLSLFVNEFRDLDTKWRDDSFNSWTGVVHFLIRNPNAYKIAGELK